MSSSSTEYMTKQFDEVLDSAQNVSPETAAFLSEWENKSPEECIVAAREVLYEGLTPIVRETLEPEQISQAHAILEAVFTKTLQNQSGRSRSRSASSS